MGQEEDRGEEGKGVKKENLEAEYRALLRAVDARTVRIIHVVDRYQKIVASVEPYIETYNRMLQFLSCY